MMISIAVRQYGVQPPNQPMQRTGRADAPQRPNETGVPSMSQSILNCDILFARLLVTPPTTKL